MLSNVLLAIKSFVTNESTRYMAGDIGNLNNRVSAAGKNLELFVRDLFSGVEHSSSDDTRTATARNLFSYLGNANNPPDLMLRGGPAIEVKKFKGSGREIQLNSSRPKNYLYSNDPKITAACREAEIWDKKDMVYAIGELNGSRLARLWLIYGDCYFADASTYTRVEKAVSQTMEGLDFELASTNELARVNKVDPRGISNLRVRGMWLTQRPEIAFDYLNIRPVSAESEIVVLLTTEKFSEMPEADIKTIVDLQEQGVSVSDVEIENPNNPARLLDAKLITYRG
jgi:hypothetical protein